MYQVTVYAISRYNGFWSRKAKIPGPLRVYTSPSLPSDRYYKGWVWEKSTCVHGGEQRFGCIHVGNAIQVYGTPTSLADTTACPHPLLSSQWQHSHCKSRSYYGNCVPVSKNVLVVTPTANIQWTAGIVLTWSSDQTDELSWQILPLLSHKLYTRASSYFHTSRERTQSSRHNFWSSPSKWPYFIVWEAYTEYHQSNNSCLLQGTIAV